MAWTLYEGDCLDVMRGMDTESVDAVVTDPPYELGFMGKSWDASGVAYNTEVWKEVLRVLKPGGHLLAFGGTRTYHRMACAIEDAGFEIRDQLQWLYGSGFPKSMDISKAIDKQAGAEREVVGMSPYYSEGRNVDNFGVAGEGTTGQRDRSITTPATPEAQQWDGWGTALKPANEPIVLARKPLSEKTIADNVLKWGTGGLHIDRCRIPTEDSLNGGAYAKNGTPRDDGWGMQRGGAGEYVQPTGRFPANVILDEEAGKLLDEQSGISRSTGGRTIKRSGGTYVGGKGDNVKHWDNKNPGFGDIGGASRFFYCAKASKKERGEGNNHPTVKPISLMRYLCQLITPPGGIILDPFAGSGTTLLAAVQEGYTPIGIEREPEYCEIIRQRMKDIDAQGRLFS